MWIFKYGLDCHFSISRIHKIELNEWIRAAGRLNGYSEMLHLYCPFASFEWEVKNAEEALMVMSEWLDAKWKSIVEQNKEDMGIVSVIV